MAVPPKASHPITSVLRPRSWKPGWGQHRPPPTPGHPGSPQGKVEVVVFIRLGTRQVWGAERCLLAGGGLLVPSCIGQYTGQQAFFDSLRFIMQPMLEHLLYTDLSVVG